MQRAARLVPRYVPHLTIAPPDAQAPQAPTPPPAPTFARPLCSALARLHTDEALHDVVFIVGQQRIGAVRALVAARSDHWEKAFFGPCRESTESEVLVGEADPQTFRQLLHFIYTDDLPAAFRRPDDQDDQSYEAPFGQVFALLELAERYNVPDLKALLVHRLHVYLLSTPPVRLLELIEHPEAGMSEELCESLNGAFKAAFQYGIKLSGLLETFGKVLQLKAQLNTSQPKAQEVLVIGAEACIMLIREKGGELMAMLTTGDQRWLQSSPEFVETVLSCQIRRIPEVEIFKALVAWWRHDNKSREEQARAIVTRVLRTSLLTYADVEAEIEPCALLSMDELKDAYKFVARDTRIAFSNVFFTEGWELTSAEQRHPSGFGWKLRLRVHNRGLVVSLCGPSTAPLRVVPPADINVSIYLGRMLLKGVLKWQSGDVATSRDAGDISSVIGANCNVTALVNFSE